MKRRAFTLVELLVALSISTLLLGAISSLFVIMARALPDDTSPLSRTSQLTRAVDRFAFDVSWATQVVQASTSKCEFIVPDCTGDAVDDSVVYKWAGAGASWTRELNGGAAETICESLKSLTFTWRCRRVAGGVGIRSLETVQVELVSADAAALPVIAKISATSHASVP